MNVRLPDLDGLEATRRITTDPGLSHIRVLVLTDDERDEYLFAALQAGASGFLIMDTEPAELVRAVRLVAGGSMQLSASVTRRMISSSPDTIRNARSLT